MITLHALKRAVERGLAKNKHFATILLTKAEKDILADSKTPRLYRGNNRHYCFVEIGGVKFWALYDFKTNAVITVVYDNKRLQAEWRTIEKVKSRGQQIFLLQNEIAALTKELRLLRRRSLFGIARRVFFCVKGILAKLRVKKPVKISSIEQGEVSRDDG